MAEEKFDSGSSVITRTGSGDDFQLFLNNIILSKMHLDQQIVNIIN